MHESCLACRTVLSSRCILPSGGDSSTEVRLKGEGSAVATMQVLFNTLKLVFPFWCMKHIHVPIFAPLLS